MLLAKASTKAISISTVAIMTTRGCSVRWARSPGCSTARKSRIGPPSHRSLVVADEISAAYNTYQSDPQAGWNRIDELLKAHQLGFIKAGAPFDSIFLDDLDLVDLSPYKLIMFLNTYNMSQASRDLVDRKVKGAGRTVAGATPPGCSTAFQSRPMPCAN